MWVNYRSKSVAGYSIEYATMNPSGYFFYSFYSIGGAIDPYLGTGTVLYNDLLFTLHGLAAACVLLVQIFIYDRGDQGRIQWWVIIFVASLWLLILSSWSVEVSGRPTANLSWDTFLLAGYSKCAISFVKYVP